MTPTITVHKLDHQGVEQLTYPGMVLERTEAYLQVEAAFTYPQVQVRGITLEEGDRFVEWYYRERWYTVFAMFEGWEGRFKGWYCNITRPARIEPGHVYSEDLALDLLVYTDYRWEVLDRQEFLDLDIPEVERTQASRALEELQVLIRQGKGPFDRESLSP